MGEGAAIQWGGAQKNDNKFVLDFKRRPGAGFTKFA